MRSLALGLLMLTFACAVTAESFSQRLEKGHALLRNGDPEAALNAYRDLQVEEPESDQLYYSIGCAQYEIGSQKAEAKASDEALAALDAANKAFQKAASSSDSAVRIAAGYNQANCLAQIAQQTLSGQDPQRATTAFEEAVAAYETFLKQHPDHQGARNNLDHVRYLLKKLLQNPPPQQDKQGQDSKDKQQQQNQQQQQGQQGQSQNDQQKDGQKKPDQQEQKSQDAQQQSQEKQEQAQAQQSDQGDKELEQPEQDKEAPPQDRKDVEAILQSLEDQDKRQQQDVRDDRHDSGRSRREWW